MSTKNGTAVNFAFTSASGITIAGLKGTLLQGVDYSAEAEKEDVRNFAGDITERSWYDQHNKANLEWVITGATDSIAAAITATTLSALVPGTLITVAGCDSDTDLNTASLGKWEVQSGAKITGSNTTSRKLSVPLERRAGITAVATA